MIEFNFAKARTGAPVITHEGRKVRIGIWDAPGTRPIVGIVINVDGTNSIPRSWTKRGCKYENGEESKYDLFMAPPVIYVSIHESRRPGVWETSPGYENVNRALLVPTGWKLMKLVEVEEETE